MDNQALLNLRQEYTRGKLTEDQLKDDPKELMEQWLSLAIDQGVQEPTAMTLATVNTDDQPSARIVLLKEIDEGFVFYSNYRSHKAQDIEANAKVSLLFFWPELERQVRIQGTVEKVSVEQSERYFKQRPKGSQLGAWSSPQSEMIGNRRVLEDRIEELSDVYRDREVLPKPSHWGGYRVLAHYYEFWQGRDNRLHDRFAYTFVNENWSIGRLAP